MTESPSAPQGVPGAQAAPAQQPAINRPGAPAGVRPAVNTGAAPSAVPPNGMANAAPARNTPPVMDNARKGHVPVKPVKGQDRQGAFFAREVFMGRNIIGVIASVLIFLSIAAFAAAVFPYLGKEARFPS